ncbi:MAG: hypothetical protein KDE11_06995 [Rhodobacteraceae bacterium]|nr:hypothetical protein [Paracoccaceae bacterium]
MGKTLAAVAVFLGLYALYDTQGAGSPARVKASEFGLSGLSAPSKGKVGDAVLGVAGKIAE